MKYEIKNGHLAPPDVCQSCKHRVKFNRRSGCKVKGVEKKIGCLDKACDKYEDLIKRS
jgi:hypothetical protein